MTWKITPGWTPADSDAAAYIAAVEAADGQALENGVKVAIDNFVLGCKADGIWDAIKVSCVLAGARTLAGALVPLVGAAPTNFNFVAGDYNRKTGLVGDGTKYLNSNRNNNADPQNSKHSAVFIVPANVAGFFICGNIFTNGSDYLDLNGTTLRTQSRPLAGSQGNIGGVIAQANSLVGHSRANSTSYEVRYNKTNATFSSTSASPASNDQLVFARNPSMPLPGLAHLAFYSIGESLNLALLDARVTTLIAQFAAAIP